MRFRKIYTVRQGRLLGFQCSRKVNTQFPRSPWIFLLGSYCFLRVTPEDLNISAHFAKDGTPRNLTEFNQIC